MFSRKVKTKELISILRDLELIDDSGCGIGFHGYDITPSVHRSEQWYQNIGGKCLDDVVAKLDNDDNKIDDKIEALLDHLGLQYITKGKSQIVKIKKGKK